MRLYAIALLGLLFAAPLHSAPPKARTLARDLAIEAPVLATRVDGWIEVGPDGRVAGYEAITTLGEPLASRLRSMVEAFRFEPVLVDGRPVLARARMRLALVASELPDRSLRVAVENVTFPDPDGTERPADAPVLTVARRTAVRYPEAVAGTGLCARVLVAVQANPDGSLREVGVRQSALLHARGSERQVQDALAHFENAALQGISRWQLAVANPEKRALTADVLTGLVAVEFQVDGGPEPRPGTWAWETRSARRDAVWLDARLAARLPGVGDVSGQEAMAGLREPRLKLRTDLRDVAL